MTRSILGPLLGAAIAATAGAAHSAPQTTNPGSLSATGDVTAVFAFSDAGDTSQLFALTLGSAGGIFNNRTDAPGTTRALGNVAGPIQFRLDNLSIPASFLNDAPDDGPGGDGFHHARYFASAADAGVTFSLAADAAIAALQGAVTIIGFEDRRGGDYDYNDLVFAFSAVAPAPTVTDVPEPASIALLGAGVVGACLMRRRRR